MAIYELEERVYFDGAAPVDLNVAGQADNSDHTEVGSVDSGVDENPGSTLNNTDIHGYSADHVSMLKGISPAVPQGEINDIISTFLSTKSVNISPETTDYDMQSELPSSLLDHIAAREDLSTDLQSAIANEGRDSFLSSPNVYNIVSHNDSIDAQGAALLEKSPYLEEQATDHLLLDAPHYPLSTIHSLLNIQN